MKIVIAGGTGFLGKNLSQYFKALGHDVIVISRSSSRFNWTTNALQMALKNADVLVNLAGRSVNCRHNEKNKQDILQSRIASTNSLAAVLKLMDQPPKLWINASAIAIYPHAFDKFYDENSNTPTTNFLSHVVQQWEDSFFNFKHPAVRQIALRTGVVLGANDGAFKPLTLLTKFGLGGRVASGKQLVSWIHILDYCRMMEFLIQNNNINGVVNCVSPQPLTNNDFMSAFRNAMGVSIGLPAPAFAVKLGTYLLGAEASLVLDSIGVLPIKIQNSGFVFNFPQIHLALKQLIKK